MSRDREENQSHPVSIQLFGEKMEPEARPGKIVHWWGLPRSTETAESLKGKGASGEAARRSDQSYIWQH
jgi:hypothetical protein